MNRGRSFGVVMTKTAVRICAGILLLSLCGVSQAQPKPQKIVIQYPATASIGGVLPWIAKEKGLFAKHRLDADLVFTTASTAMQALIAGSIDIAIGDVLAPLAAFGGGADVIVIGSFANSTPYVMAARSGVRRVADLKGGKIGIQSPTGRGTIFTRFVLEEAGLDPDRDVQILRVGGTGARVAALASGHIDGALVNPGVADQLKKAGLNALHLRGVAFIDAELHLMRRRLEERRTAVLAAFRAIKEAAVYMKSERSGSVDVIQKLMRVDRQAAETAYDVWVQYVVTEPEIPGKVIQETLRLAERMDPRLKQINVSRLFDMGLAAQLDAGK
jgi:ABC-type nitrate/sulfonate/bicarbonate transport system substrate-binding protein